jgi:hypothetical protein
MIANDDTEPEVGARVGQTTLAIPGYCAGDPLGPLKP